MNKIVLLILTSVFGLNVGACLAPAENIGEAPEAIGCATDTDCAPASGACVKAACVAGGCTTEPVPVGAPCNSPDGVGVCDSAGLCNFTPGYNLCNSYGSSPTVCATDFDCEDANECTGDTCINGYCHHTQLAAGSPCASGSGSMLCAWGQCCPLATGACGPLGRKPPSSCTTDRDCADGNPCSTDRCIGGTCSNVSVPNNTYCKQYWSGDVHEGRCNAGHCCEPF